MKTYLVGGAVRDRLLGLPQSERDWVVVGATPDELLARGFRQVGRDFPVFLHPDTHEEYALARTERKTGPGHTGFACNSDPSVTLEEDLSRRDLTINAMAEDTDGVIVDPYGGRDDLAQRLLRHVSAAFVEDPLRVLRAARFAARFADLGFRIEASTLELMRTIADSGELAQLPSERIWAELEKALATRSPAVFFDSLRDCGALDKLMPELDQHPRAVAALAGAAADCDDPLLRYALIFSFLPEATASALNKRLRAPRRYQDLALLCSRHGPAYADAATLSAEQLLQLLEDSDAFRRPQRFEQFLRACALAHPDALGSGELLHRAFEVCRDVDTTALGEASLSGREIGERLHRERRQRLEQLDPPGHSRRID
jgi:tRNA nucleotidyltransferase (CCA-adding enzyme)